MATERMKLPAIQFYPGDWLRDPGVRACSLQARGLWIEMLCLMHEGEPYGHLTINGRAIELRTLSRLVGAEMKRTCAALKELESNGVFSRTKDGTIYSRRMVKDAYLRAIRAKAGSLGGKTTSQFLLKQMPKQNFKQTTPPSSSSSTAVNTPLTPPSGDLAAPKSPDPKIDIPNALSPRAQGINPRALGMNPRALNRNPRALRTNPRTVQRIAVEAIFKHDFDRRQRVDREFQYEMTAEEMDRIKRENAPRLCRT